MSGITNILHNSYINSCLQVISIVLELREALVRHSVEHCNGKHIFLVHGFPTNSLLPFNFVKL